LAELGVDQLGQTRRIGFVADVPRLQPRQFGVGHTGAGLGHLGEAQIDGIGENGRQQQMLVVGCRAILEVLEVAAEAGPAIDFQQQFGDLQVRQQAACLLHQRLGLIRHGIVQRRNLDSPGTGDGRIG